MAYKILEQNGTEIENVDGAAFNNFVAGGQDCIIKGALNECKLTASTSNTLVLSKGVLVIQGVRVKITSEETFVLQSAPVTNQQYQVVAQIEVNANRNVNFSLYVQLAGETLQKDNIFATETGIYAVTIGTFTYTAQGTIIDIVTSLPIILGATSSPGGSIEERIKELEDQVADLLYKAITITSFTNNVNTVEIGSTVTAVNLTWAFSKTPKTVTLDGATKAVDSTGESLTGLSITANKTWDLRATDERDAVATRTTAISFLNGVYYGVAEAPSTYDSAFVLGLTKTLRSSKLTSFSANAGAGQFIYYCIPTRFGTASFKVGGFDGGFSLVATIPFTNSKGYTENYYIYKSDNANLGATAVSVS